jgi:hypothetical protein
VHGLSACLWDAQASGRRVLAASSESQALGAARKRATHPDGCQKLRWERAFPGETLVSDERARSAQLGIGEYHQPGPAVGLLRVAHARQHPVERLFEEAGRMLKVEPADDARQIRSRSGW